MPKFKLDHLSRLSKINQILQINQILIFVEIFSILLYLGGYDGSGWLKTTEFIHPNGSKTEDPIELPEPRYYHCMVEYAGIIALMGGRYATLCGQILFNT